MASAAESSTRRTRLPATRQQVKPIQAMRPGRTAARRRSSPKPSAPLVGSRAASAASRKRSSKSDESTKAQASYNDAGSLARVSVQGEEGEAEAKRRRVEEDGARVINAGAADVAQGPAKSKPLSPRIEESPEFAERMIRQALRDAKLGIIRLPPPRMPEMETAFKELEKEIALQRLAYANRKDELVRAAYGQWVAFIGGRQVGPFVEKERVFNAIEAVQREEEQYRDKTPFLTIIEKEKELSGQWEI